MLVLGVADKLCQPVEIGGVVVAILVLPAGGVDVYLQQLGGAFGEEFHRLGRGGQQHTFACVDGLDALHRFHGGDAVDAEVHYKAVQFRKIFPHRLGERDEVGGEVGAFSQQGGAVLFVAIMCLAVAGGTKVYGIQCFGGVQLAQLAVCVGAVVVVDAVGAVAAVSRPVATPCPAHALGRQG